MAGEKRLKWLDGLKGLACMGVFTHHFMLGLFPASYYGDEAPLRLADGLDLRLSYSPVSVLINGNFWVHLFILISAFLPAVAMMRCHDDQFRDKAATTLLRRYPRLALPIGCFAIFNYILLRLLMHFNLNYSGKELNYGPWEYLRHTFFVQYFTQDDTVLGPLWTIHYLFFGAIYAVLLSIPARKKKRFTPLWLVLLILPVGSVDWNYLPVILGVLLADLYCHERLGWLSDKLTFLGSRGGGAAAAVLLIALGLFLGGYPTYVTPYNVYHVFITLGPLWSILGILNTAAFLHALAAFFVMGGLLLWHSHALPSPLSSRPMQFLGRNCMGIFLWHIPWLEYLGYYLYNEILLSRTGSRGIAALVLYPVLCVLILLSAQLYHILVEKPCDKLCAKIHG